MSTTTADCTATIPVPPELLALIRKAIAGQLDTAAGDVTHQIDTDGEQYAVDAIEHVIAVRADMLEDRDEYPAGSVRAAAGWAMAWQVNAPLEGDSLTLDEAEELVRHGRALEALIAAAV